MKTLLDRFVKSLNPILPSAKSSDIARIIPALDAVKKCAESSFSRAELITIKHLIASVETDLIEQFEARIEARQADEGMSAIVEAIKVLDGIVHKCSAQLVQVEIDEICNGN